MKNYGKSVISLYLLYLNANNLYGLVMSQKLPVNGFKWVTNVSRFHEDFIKSYNENSNKEYILEVDIEYPKHFLNLQGDLPFLSERTKIKKCNKLVCNIHDKENYCSHKSSKTSIKSWSNILKST